MKLSKWESYNYVMQFEDFEVLSGEECFMVNLTRKEEQILLAILQIGEDAYLIPIREQIKKYTGKYYSVGTIYAPLNRLHINGYLESSIKKTDSSNIGKPIKYYKLTRKGYEALEALRKQNEVMWKGFVTPVFEK